MSDSTVQCSSTEEVIEVDINEAYISNMQIPTEPNVAYSTSRPAQAGQSIMPHDYEYVVMFIQLTCRYQMLCCFPNPVS